MTITDESMLDNFRGPGRCDLCWKECLATEPHHVKAKGIGGGSRLDISINLLRVGSTLRWCCPCHNAIHNGHVPKDDVINAVAKREGTSADAIRMAIYVILSLPKRCTNKDVAGAIASRFAEPKTDTLAVEVKRLVDQALCDNLNKRKVKR